MAYKHMFIVFGLFGIGFTVRGLSGFSQAIEYSNMTWLYLLGGTTELILGIIGFIVSYRNLKMWKRYISI